MNLINLDYIKSTANLDIKRYWNQLVIVLLEIGKDSKLSFNCWSENRKH